LLRNTPPGSIGSMQLPRSLLTRRSFFPAAALPATQRAPAPTATEFGRGPESFRRSCD
jgi:hypothetical protein